MNLYLLLFRIVAPAICLAGLLQEVNAQDQSSVVSDNIGNTYAIRKFPDNRWWMTENLKIDIPGSYCYNNDTGNCRQYGRLYTWEAAGQGCITLGPNWRLPTEPEWQQLAGYFGGVRETSADSGRAAFRLLLRGGDAGFNATLSGSRDLDGSYKRLNGHGLYWTSTHTDSTAWFYNFGNGMKGLFRHDDGEKMRAFSVRCVKNE